MLQGFADHVGNLDKKSITIQPQTYVIYDNLLFLNTCKLQRGFGFMYSEDRGEQLSSITMDNNIKYDVNILGFTHHMNHTKICLQYVLQESKSGSDFNSDVVQEGYISICLRQTRLYGYLMSTSHQILQNIIILGVANTSLLTIDLRGVIEHSRKTSECDHLPPSRIRRPQSPITYICHDNKHNLVKLVPAVINPSSAIKCLFAESIYDKHHKHRFRDAISEVTYPVFATAVTKYLIRETIVEEDLIKCCINGFNFIL